MLSSSLRSQHAALNATLDLDEHLEFAAQLDSINQSSSREYSFRIEQPNCAKVFTVGQLLPNMSYLLMFEGLDNSHDRMCSFSTPPSHLDAMQRVQIIALAGDTDNATHCCAAQYLQTLENKEPRFSTLCLHMGGMFDGSIVFERSLELLERDESDADLRIMEMYRGMYREAFNATTMRHILSSSSNYFVIGYGEETRYLSSIMQNEQSNEYLVREYARRVFCEYCRQLWDDNEVISAPISSKPFGESFYFKLDTFKTAVIMLDNPFESVHGDSMKRNLFLDYLSNVLLDTQPSVLDDVEHLVIATHLPLLLPEPQIHQCAAATRNVSQHLELAKLLHRWQNQSAKPRNIFSVSSSESFGSLSRIVFQGSTVLTQIVSMGELLLADNSTTFINSLDELKLKSIQFSDSFGDSHNDNSSVFSFHYDKLVTTPLLTILNFKFKNEFKFNLRCFYNDVYSVHYFMQGSGAKLDPPMCCMKMKSKPLTPATSYDVIPQHLKSNGMDSHPDPLNTVRNGHSLQKRPSSGRIKTLFDAVSKGSFVMKKNEKSGFKVEARVPSPKSRRSSLLQAGRNLQEFLRIPTKQEARKSLILEDHNNYLQEMNVEQPTPENKIEETIVAERKSLELAQSLAEPVRRSSKSAPPSMSPRIGQQPSSVPQPVVAQLARPKPKKNFLKKFGSCFGLS